MCWVSYHVQVPVLQEAARNEGFVASYDVKPKPKDPSIVLLARVAAWLITTYVLLFSLISISFAVSNDNIML